MATRSSTPAWRMPRTEEPGGLQSTRLQSQIQLSNWAHPTSSKSYLEARRAFPPKKPCCTCDVEGQLSQADLFGRQIRRGPVTSITAWWEGPTHRKRPRCWERLRAGGGGGDDRGQDGWMASPTQALTHIHTTVSKTET